MNVTITVKDLGCIITGNTPPRSNPKLYGHHTPFIKATDISETSKYTYSPEEFYSKEGYERYKSSLIPKGATCVVTIGSVGKKMTMAHCDCFINQAMNAIVVNDKFDSEYVYYLLKNNIHKLKMLNSGTASGRENVSKSAFSNMELSVINDRNTQHRIGKILATYDELIENNQKQIKLLEEAAQRLYKEWFVDLRFPGHENVKIVDGVPESWKIVALCDYCYVTDGTHDSPKTQSFGIPLVTGKCIKNGYIDFNEANLITETEHKKIQLRSSLKTGDILFSNIGTIGNTCRINYNREFSVKNVIILKPISDIQSIFLYYWIKSDNIQKSFASQTNGSSQQFIGLSFMRNYKILTPSKYILDSFSQIVQPLEKRKDLLYYQNLHLLEARDRLLPKLMSGEIQV